MHGVFDKKFDIQHVFLPYYSCNSIANRCRNCGTNVDYYHVDSDFLPILEGINENGWIFVVSYYGQLDSAYIQDLRHKFGNLIVDNTQAFYCEPIEGVHTIYSCRKIFGVPAFI